MVCFWLLLMLVFIGSCKSRTPQKYPLCSIGGALGWSPPVTDIRFQVHPCPSPWRFSRTYRSWKRNVRASPVRCVRMCAGGLSGTSAGWPKGKVNRCMRLRWLLRCCRCATLRMPWRRARRNPAVGVCRWLFRRWCRCALVLLSFPFVAVISCKNSVWL